MFVILVGALGGTFEFREDAIMNDKFFENAAIHVDQDETKGTIRYTIKRHKIVEGEIVGQTETEGNPEEMLENKVQPDANDDHSV